MLEAAYRLFYSNGFNQVTVDAVAAEAGVTKRTFYNHFDSKDALIAAVMERQTSSARALVLEWLGEGTSSHEDLIRNLFSGLRRWAAAPDWRGSGFTRIAMELAWAPGHPARRAAATHKKAVEDEFAEALSAAGAPEPQASAAGLMLLVEGANALRLIHGDERWYDLAETAALAIRRPSTDRS
jgi:AcrR family transcriptional regulator